MATTTDSFVLLKVWQLSKRAACKQRLNYLTEKLCIWITHKQTFKDLNTTINTARRVILHEKIHWKRRRLTGESRDIFRSCTLSQFVCLWSEVCAVKWHYESVSELSSAEFILKSVCTCCCDCYQASWCQAASECVKLNLKPDSASCWSGGKQHFRFYLTNHTLRPNVHTICPK